MTADAPPAIETAWAPIACQEHARFTETYGFAGSQGVVNLEGLRLRPRDRPSDTLLVYMHPSSTLLPVPGAAVAQGAHVLCAGSRYARNDSALILEKVLAGLQAAPGGRPGRPTAGDGSPTLDTRPESPGYGPPGGRVVGAQPGLHRGRAHRYTQEFEFKSNDQVRLWLPVGADERGLGHGGHRPADTVVRLLAQPQHRDGQDAARRHAPRRRADERRLQALRGDRAGARSGTPGLLGARAPRLP